MFEFFDRIIGFFELIFQIIQNVIESLLLAVGLVATSSTFTLQLSAFLPLFLSSALLIFFAVAIVKFLVGR